MKNIIFIFIISLFFLPAVQHANAQEDYEQQLEASKKLIDALAPGEEHQLLTVFGGSWRQLCEIPQTDGPPNHGKGNATGIVILGGRYVRIASELEFEPFGISSDITIGFDKLKRIFVFYSFDNLSTYPSVAEGRFDNANMIFEFKGKTYSEMQDNKVPFRIVIKFEDKNKYTYEVYVGEGDEEQLRQKILNIRLN